MYGLEDEISDAYYITNYGTLHLIVQYIEITVCQNQKRLHSVKIYII
jgi:hypothetical protein